VIKDQYGTFEYEKDPDGYKKARKRQQNRESALRARDKRINKLGSIESKLKRIEDKSTKLEKENLVLKAEKQQLQDQVTNLLSIIKAFGQHKRFKTGENIEVVWGNESEKVTDEENKESTNHLSESNNLVEEMDKGDFDIPSPFDDQGEQISPKVYSPEKSFLKLVREDKDSIFAQDDDNNSGFGDVFQKGMMLSLTILMCMIACLTGFSISSTIAETTQKLWTQWSASANPFGFRSAESKILMTHPIEPHYEAESFSLVNIGITWWTIFLVLTISVILIKRPLFQMYYKFFNLIVGPVKQVAKSD
jgi:hypothetical protein